MTTGTNASTYLEDVNGFTIWTEATSDDWWCIVTHAKGSMSAIYVGENVWEATQELAEMEQMDWDDAYEQVCSEELEKARDFCRNNDSKSLRVAEYAEYIKANGGFEQGRVCDKLSSLQQWLEDGADNLTGTALDKTDAINEWLS